MAHKFAQHASVGNLHLETHHVAANKPDERWEWEVLLNGRDRVFSGASGSLKDAKSAAMNAAKVKDGTVSWQDIGTAIEGERLPGAQG
jgi:hypothetical protein